MFQRIFSSGDTMDQTNIPIIIKDANILTMNRNFDILSCSSILVDDGKIIDIDSYEVLRSKMAGRDCRVLDAKGKYAMPGMICAHTHFYGAFARGMGLKDEPPSNFKEILQRLWWRLDLALEDEDVYYSSLLLMLDAVRHGTTTLIDHHASPNRIAGSLDVIEKAARTTGIRSCLCYEVTDRNGVEGAMEGINENRRFLERVRNGDTGITRATFGLHASLSLSDETLKICRSNADDLNSGFHVHVAEGISDLRDSRSKYGKSVVQRFRDLGILEPKSMAIHCVHVDEADMVILKETGTKVIHNPESNMNNAVGVSPVLEMQDRGIKVGIGTDGFCQDMFREMKFVYVLHKLHKSDPRVMGGDNVLQMQTHNNSEIASLFWDEPLGVIKKGALADIILLEYNPNTPLNPGNLPWHIEFGIDATNVTHTMINGRFLMEDRVIAGFDMDKLSEMSRELACKVWDRF